MLALINFILPSQRIRKNSNHRPGTVLNTSESQSFNYAQGKTDTETNFVVTVGFTIKVDHQTTFEIWSDFRSCLMINLGRETDGNNEICLGVRFALCILPSQKVLSKSLRNNFELECGAYHSQVAVSGKGKTLTLANCFLGRLFVFNFLNSTLFKRCSLGQRPWTVTLY